MMHRNRTHSVVVVSTDELVEKLGEHGWTGCTGFVTRAGTLWLNDSTSPDAAQEYAVWRLEIGYTALWRQVETITTSWCTREKIAHYIIQADAGKFDHQNLASHQPCWEMAPEHDACALCM